MHSNIRGRLAQNEGILPRFKGSLTEDDGTVPRLTGEVPGIISTMAQEYFLVSYSLPCAVPGITGSPAGIPVTITGTL